MRYVSGADGFDMCTLLPRLGTFRLENVGLQTGFYVIWWRSKSRLFSLDPSPNQKVISRRAREGFQCSGWRLSALSGLDCRCSCCLCWRYGRGHYLELQRFDLGWWPWTLSFANYANVSWNTRFRSPVYTFCRTTRCIFRGELSHTKSWRGARTSSNNIKKMLVQF